MEMLTIEHLMKSTKPLLLTIPFGLPWIAGLALVAALPATAQTAFRVTADPENLSGSFMTLDHPAINGKPKAKPVVTQFWDGTYNAHPVGVEYKASSGRWRIVNEDDAAMPLNTKFNVLLAKGAKTVLASPANSFSNVTLLATAKGKPDAKLLVTHIINPVAALPGTLSARFYGVTFLASVGGGQWSVFAEDDANMEAIGFNIADVTNLKIGTDPASFIFTTSVANIIDHTATITHPLTDGNPNALVFVQHVYNAASPTYLNESVSVYYAGGKWRVFNQDFTAMPASAAFVVAVQQPEVFE